MKKIFFAFAIAAMALTSCIKSDVGKTNATAQTLDAQNITFEGFTLGAKFTIKGDGNTHCKYGILVGTEPGLTYKTGMFTSNEDVNNPGAYEYTYQFKNVLNDLIVPIVKFFPGQEVYYRAAIELVGIDESKYIYGEEKSLIIPLKQ